MLKKAKKAKKPVVYHTHTTYEDFRGSVKFSNQLAPIIKFWVKKLYNNADYLITPTEYTKKLIEKKYLKSPKEIRVISNGVSNKKFSEKDQLKDKFLTGTSLSLTNSAGDLTLEGSITSYNVSPQAIQSNEVAAQNRLTISVNVKFTNLKDEKQNFETTFSRYADFQSNININTIEEQLITEINEQLADDIFNKAVINW